MTVTPAHYPASDDDIDTLLRWDAAVANDHIDIGPFGEQVMARIPHAERRAVGKSMRLVIIGGAVALSCLLALFAGAGVDFLVDAVMDLATETLTPSVLSAAALLVAFSAGGAVLAGSEHW